MDLNKKCDARCKNCLAIDSNLQICENCYHELSTKATWNLQIANNELKMLEFTQILELLNEIISKINKIELYHDLKNIK